MDFDDLTFEDLDALLEEGYEALLKEGYETDETDTTQVTKREMNKYALFPMQPLVDILRGNTSCAITYPARHMFLCMICSIADTVMEMMFASSRTRIDVMFLHSIFTELEFPFPWRRNGRLSISRLLIKYRNRPFVLPDITKQMLQVGMYNIAYELAETIRINNPQKTIKLIHVQNVADVTIIMGEYTALKHSARSIHAKKRKRNKNGTYM